MLGMEMAVRMATAMMGIAASDGSSPVSVPSYAPVCGTLLDGVESGLAHGAEPAILRTIAANGAPPSASSFCVRLLLTIGVAKMVEA